MARTRSFKDLVEHQIKADSKFAEALLREGIDAMLSGDLDTVRRQIALADFAKNCGPEVVDDHGVLPGWG